MAHDNGATPRPTRSNTKKADHDKTHKTHRTINGNGANEPEDCA